MKKRRIVILLGWMLLTACGKSEIEPTTSVAPTLNNEPIVTSITSSNTEFEGYYVNRFEVSSFCTGQGAIAPSLSHFGLSNEAENSHYVAPAILVLNHAQCAKGG